jgi:hypothetical protein
MFDTHDEWIGKWGHKPGPRVGDWCETKDGGLHRIGAIRGESIRLAGPSGRFSLGSEGVLYSGLLLDYPAAPHRAVSCFQRRGYDAVALW